MDVNKFKQRSMYNLNAIDGQERERWRGTMEKLEDDMSEYEVIKGNHVDNDEMEKETMRYLRGMWNSRHGYERLRECALE